MRHFPEEENIIYTVFSELKSLGVKVPKVKKFISNIPKQEKSVFTCKIFGVSLSEQEKIDVSGLLLPKFVVNVTSYLSKFIKKEIGLFRKAGSIARQRDLRGKLENGQSIEESEPNDVASLLKQWLRELPEPLIPLYLHDLFLRCHKIEDDVNRVKAVLLCCYLLPVNHLHTLKYLMSFLSDIALNSGENKMGAHNLAVVMAPNIFVIERECIDKSSNLIQQHTSLIELLINNAAEIGMPSNFTSLHLMENDILNYGTDLDVSEDTTDSSPNKLKKKQRSGTVQELFSGIRKLVGQNSISPNPPRNQNRDANQSIISTIPNSASKRKADESISLSAIKKQATESRIQKSPVTTPVCETNSTVKGRTRKAHFRKKSLGFLKKNRPKAVEVKTSSEVQNISSSFPEKVCLPYEDSNKTNEKNFAVFSPLLSPASIDNIFSQSPFAKKSISDCYLTPKAEEFKDIPVQTNSANGHLHNKNNKSPYNLRSNNDSNKQATKRKSDALMNDTAFFSPKSTEEDKENTPVLKEVSQKSSLSPLGIQHTQKADISSNWNIGSPVLKDCYIALNNVKISKSNLEVPQEFTISGKIMRLSDKSDSTFNQSSNSTMSQNESLNNIQALNEDCLKINKVDLEFIDINGSADKLNVNFEEESDQIPMQNIKAKDERNSTEISNITKAPNKKGGNKKRAEKENSRSNLKTSKERGSKEIVVSSSKLYPPESNVKRKTSIARQEAFRIKSRDDKEILTCVQSANQVLISPIKEKSQSKSKNNQKKENGKSQSDKAKTKDKAKTSDDNHAKRNIRKGSIIRGKPNTISSGLPSGVNKRFSSESFKSIRNSSLTSDDDLINDRSESKKNDDDEISDILKLENITLKSPPNLDPVIQETVKYNKNLTIESPNSNLVANSELSKPEAPFVCIPKRNVSQKRKSRIKISSHSDSKIYRGRKVAKVDRTNSFPGPKSETNKVQKRLKQKKSCSPRKYRYIDSPPNKENVSVSNSTEIVHESNIKTPVGNSHSSEVWVSARVLENQTYEEDDVFNKRESIAMIIKSKPGHVQAKVNLYNTRSRKSSVNTPSSVKSTPGKVFYDTPSSNGFNREYQRQFSSFKSAKTSNKKSNLASRNGIRNIPPPPKFVMPDVNSPSPKPCPLKEVTNINNADDLPFTISPAKNSANTSFKENSPAVKIKSKSPSCKERSKSLHKENYKSPVLRKNSKSPLCKEKSKPVLSLKLEKYTYPGHTPYKLSKALRSESSPNLPQKIDKSLICDSVSRSPSLVKDFKPRFDHSSPVFKTRSYVNINNQRLDLIK